MRTVPAVFRLISLHAAVLLLASVSAFAQGGDVGSIVGAVTDKGGGALSGATVTVLDTQRGVTRTLKTDDAGQYSAPNLTPGTYAVKAEYTGFQALEQKNILVQVGTQIRIDLSLSPGAQTQTIEVTEEAPLVETTNAVLGGALNNQLISDLPLNGRNFNRLLDLQPGLYVQPGSGKWSQSSNGMRAEHNVYILNGIDTVEGFSSQSVLNSSPVFGDATSILPVDSIQEFNTEQNPTAEYGWKPGAIVNVGLKSGTNTIHGTANAFGRDSALDATNSFIPAGSPKQQTAIETFGATVGGPIVKDKLFYFLGYEGQNNHISAPSSSDSLPTINPLTGSTATIQNTYSLLTACNKLTTAPSALSLKLAGLTYGGTPGTCAATSPYTGIFQTADITNGADPVTPIGNDKVNNGLAKVDYHLNEKNTLSGEYFVGNFDGLGFQGAPAQPYWDVTSHAKSMVIGAHWTYLPTSSIVNEAHFGVNRFFQPSYPGDCSNIGQPSGEVGINWGTQQDVITQTGQPANCGMPPITIQGFTATGCCSSFPKIQGPDYTIQGIDSLSYIRGSHSFKFGGEARHMSTKEGTYSQSRGTISFANGAGGLTGLQEFLLGNISTSTLPSELVGTPDVHVTDKGYSLFAQDDWRLRRTFTVNLGVRYERVTPIQESNNQLANFDPNTPTGLIQLGQTKSLYPAWNNFSPRIGFAWDITGSSKWVVRGGFNIISVLEGFNVFISQQGTSPVTTGLNTIPTGAFLNNGTATVPGTGNMETAVLTFQSINWLNPTTPVFPAVSPTQLACNNPTNAAPNNNTCPILAVNPNLRRPYAPAWNLSLQHALNNDLSLQVAYVGSHGVGLLGLNDVNAPASGSGWETYNAATKTCSPGSGPTAAISTTCENLSRPYFSEFPYLSNVNQIQNLDMSNYNALQVTLTERPWHGLNYVLGYVYSHCFEMSSGDWNGATLPSDIRNPRADYGNCLTDVRHSLTWSLSYALPSKHGYGQMLEGWKVNSVVKYQTALPWNVADTKDNISGTGELEDRWDFYGNPSQFADLGYAGVPYFTGTSNAACLTQAQTLDSSYTPVVSGWTTAKSGYVAALTKFGCFANGSSIMLPPAFGTFGNEQRYGFRGESFREWDLSISKLVRFTERLSGEFRFETFNVLNQTDFYTNSANPSVSGSFGSSRQTPDVGIANATVGSGGPRSIQLGLRLEF